MQIKTLPRYSVLPIRIVEIQHTQLVMLQENRHFHTVLRKAIWYYLLNLCECVYLLVQQPHFWEFILQMNLHKYNEHRKLKYPFWLVK